MALTRITGTKYLKVNSIEGAKNTNISGEGQIGQHTINTFNLTDSAITPAKILATGDFNFNKVTTVSDVTVGGKVEVTGSAAAATLAIGVDKFTVDSSGNTAISGNLQVTGNFQVDGTTTTVNSTTLDVVDSNITVSKGGNAAAAEGSGLTVELTDGTNGSLIYKTASATKFAIGAEGAEVDVVGTTSTQTLSNKTISLITPLTVNYVSQTTVEGALSALSTAMGGESKTLFTDSSALVDGITLTVAGAVTISAVYISGIRLSLGAGADYTVSSNVITFLESAPAGLNVVVDYK